MDHAEQIVTLAGCTKTMEESPADAAALLIDAAALIASDGHVGTSELAQRLEGSFKTLAAAGEAVAMMSDAAIHKGRNPVN